MRGRSAVQRDERLVVADSAAAFRDERLLAVEAAMASRMEQPPVPSQGGACSQGLPAPADMLPRAAWADVDAAQVKLARHIRSRNTFKRVILVALALLASVPLLVGFSMLRGQPVSNVVSAEPTETTAMPPPSPKLGPDAEALDDDPHSSLGEHNQRTSEPLFAGQAVLHPPYSKAGNCKRDYDRGGRGVGFTRCGKGGEAVTCCRSYAGVPCYYTADEGLCDSFDGGYAAPEGREANAPTAAAAADDDEALESEGAPVKRESSADATTDDASALHVRSAVPVADAASSIHARPLVPMITPSATASATGASRRPRLMRYPLLNLTWTRGSVPPRADGWTPSERQRSRLPSRDLKERYYRSCAHAAGRGTCTAPGAWRASLSAPAPPTLISSP